MFSFLVNFEGIVIQYLSHPQIDNNNERRVLGRELLLSTLLIQDFSSLGKIVTNFNSMFIIW
ncbi:hypothetical protein QFZ28_003753 [Neobacillus niacini]|nr:hypothetical protein [Neobacillus niacini]